MDTDLPPYFENVLDSYERGTHNRCVHLGYYAPNTLSSNWTLQEAQEEFDDRLLSEAALSPAQKVLDVGCGLGGLVDRINSKYNRMNIVGLSNDPRQLEICNSIRPKNHNSVAWVEADACLLPFPSASFDRVFCVEAAFHFGSRRRFYAEAQRVLKPGGLLICTDIILRESSFQFPNNARCDSGPQANDIEAFTKRSIHSLLLSAFAPWPDPWYSMASMQNEIIEVGLTAPQIQDWTLQTSPSYQGMVSQSKPQGDHGTRDPMLAALSTLQFLHLNQLLQYVYFTCVKNY